MILVTGLPRSGTSLLMQLLEAGGVPVFVDDQGRESHATNERGNYEHAATYADAGTSGWLAEAQGKAVKVVADRLHALPAGLDCPILVARRSLAETAASRGVGLAAHVAWRQGLDRWLLGRRHLPVYHRSLFVNPAPTLDAIRRYLGMDLDLAAMAAAIDPGLYHHRAG